jgi:hypothetical protein
MVDHFEVRFGLGHPAVIALGRIDTPAARKIRLPVLRPGWREEKKHEN